MPDVTKGLNPFEFRAGIYLSTLAELAESAAVLIPLNSGLVFTSPIGADMAKIQGLNPFEFRAGIYLQNAALSAICAKS